MDTLLLLVTSGGRVLSRGEMTRQLWPDTFVEEGTLTQYISVLRKTLGEHGRSIENIPRRGYRFTAAVDSPADQTLSLDCHLPEKAGSVDASRARRSVRHRNARILLRPQLSRRYRQRPK
jgi:DNA-binding winged helix-turn-helix (wHTH) protein